MSALATVLGTTPAPHPRRDAFLKWQCRVRQIAMRENAGRPDNTIKPALTLHGETEPMGHIITLICKMPHYSVTPEMQHMFKRTNDPAQRREKALQFFSATHYQKAAEFSDVLTATFPPGSPGAAKIRRAERVTLTFDAYNQRFDIAARVWALTKANALYQATYWHNALFNPSLSEGTTVLGFEPDWDASTAEPELGK